MGDFNNAKWIWCGNDKNAYDQYVYFRKEIDLSDEVCSIEINISACHRYKLYIDGIMQGQGPCPSMPEYQYYDTYKLKEELQDKKEICLAAVAYNMGENVPMVIDQNKGLAAFICSIKLYLKDGSSRTIDTDETWKVLKSPTYFEDYIKLGYSRISNWSGFKEVFVSEQEPATWKCIGFNDSNWINGVLVEGADNHFKHLLPRDIPFLQEEDVYPKSIVQLEKNLGSINSEENLLLQDESYAIVDASVPGSFPAVVLDFNKEVVGYVEVTLKGSKGGNMSLWYGESLDLQRVDTLIMNGEEQIFAPYHRRAFRYLKLSFNNCMEPIKVINVKIKHTHYPYKDRGSFECSDELLNNIWETSVYTTKLGTQEHFEDSIWREKAQWLGDARVMSMVNYWVFKEPAIIKKAIRQFFREQNQDGSIPGTGPQKPLWIHLDYCAHFVIMIKEYYFYTKDLEFIEEIYPQLKRLMEFFESIEDEDGFIKIPSHIPGAGIFIDWADIDKRDKITSLNCFYRKALREFAEICELLKNEETQKYEDKSLKLKDTINRIMFNKEEGLYVDCVIGGVQSDRYSQQSNIIAVFCQVASEDLVKSIIEKVYVKEGIETIKGAFLLSFTTDILFEKGFKQKSLELIKDFWGEMLKRGATTWWETFNRATPHSCIPYAFAPNSPTYLIEYIPVSLCHAWGAGPAYVLMKNILGIKPVKEGFKEIVFDPYTEGINYCKGTVPTIYGDIKVEWKKDEEGKIQYHIDKPKDIELIEKGE